jgi:hypothetical protein
MQNQKCMIGIVSTMSIMLLPSTFLHCLPSKIDGGLLISKSINISNTAISHSPELSVSQGKNLVGDDSVSVVWNDNSTGNGDIYFKRSADNGTTFGSTQNLSNNPGNSTVAQMAAYQDNVYVLWEDAATGDGDIYFKASLDNGNKYADKSP